MHLISNVLEIFITTSLFVRTINNKSGSNFYINNLPFYFYFVFDLLFFSISYIPHRERKFAVIFCTLSSTPWGRPKWEYGGINPGG